MKIYTRTGDTGTTGLFAGPRVSKNDSRIEAFGTVDELNAVLGVVRAQSLDEDIATEIQQLQSDLFTVGARLATTDPTRLTIELVNDADVLRIEKWIDKHESDLPDLKHFILPGGSMAAASLHQARTVSRRAERCVVTLYEDIQATDYAQIIVFLNRLSDYLFVLARLVNHRARIEDTIWIGQSSQCE